MAPCACAPAFAFDVRRPTLEGLMELDVCSVSRCAETLRQTAAPAYAGGLYTKVNWRF